MTLAATNSIAEAFGQAATHAPQPMQAAASMAFSALSFGMRMALASQALPVLTETKPPACCMRSNAERSTARSLTTGKAFARNGSIVDGVAVLVACACAAGRWSSRLVRAVRLAVDVQRAHAADALAAVVVESDGVRRPLRSSLSLTTSSISRKGHVGRDSLALYR